MDFAVPVEGGKLAGEQRGESPRLLFLHGFSGSRATWDRLWSALPGDLPMLRYDLRGFGASTAEPGVEFSHADDLLALMDTRGIARTTIVGLSLGGGVAANFALDHPERVDRLVLVSPMLMGWDWSPEWRDLWRGMVKAARGGDMAEARRLWWAHPLFATLRGTGAGEEQRRSIEAFSGDQWLRSDERAVMPDVERLHELAVSTLLLTGEKDVADFRLIAELLEASVPDLRRIDFAVAGHMLHLERPREAAEAIRAFVAD